MIQYTPRLNNYISDLCYRASRDLPISDAEHVSSTDINTMIHNVIQLLNQILTDKDTDALTVFFTKLENAVTSMLDDGGPFTNLVENQSSFQEILKTNNLPAYTDYTDLLDNTMLNNPNAVVTINNCQVSRTTIFVCNYLMQQPDIINDTFAIKIFTYIDYSCGILKSIIDFYK